MIGIEDDLPQLVQRGGIAAGLVQSALRIKLPPLRERGEDLPALVTRFLRLDAAGRALVFTDAAMQTLQRHTWPQNLRELRRTLRDLAARVTGDVVDAPDLPAHMRFRLPPSDDASLRRPLADVEAEHIRAVLLAEGGNKARTAEVLRIDRKTLRDKLRRYGIGRDD
jgi:DNA-binding NtrC family response regulator